MFKSKCKPLVAVFRRSRTNYFDIPNVHVSPPTNADLAQIKIEGA